MLHWYSGYFHLCLLKNDTLEIYVLLHYDMQKNHMDIWFHDHEYSPAIVKEVKMDTHCRIYFNSNPPSHMCIYLDINLENSEYFLIVLDFILKSIDINKWSCPTDI